MSNAEKEAWIDARIEEKAEARHKKFLEPPASGVIAVDAGKFAQQLADVATTLINRIEREGRTVLGGDDLVMCIAFILRQLTETYRLIGLINSDEIRMDTSRYNLSYSFVSLPLVRTMIDGFYNCTALLDDRRRERVFRISGFYRIRESLKSDEAAYGHDPTWMKYLKMQRDAYEHRMRVCSFSDVDLDDKKNKWPLLQSYLQTPPVTPHKQMLSKLTLGIWKEYSSVSHTSFDGLTEHRALHLQKRHTARSASKAARSRATCDCAAPRAHRWHFCVSAHGAAGVLQVRWRPHRRAPCGRLGGYDRDA